MTTPFELLPAQFCNWQLVQKLPGEKPTKVPCGPDGRAIDPTNPATWMTYAQAAATGLPVAFNFTANDPFVFIDLDGCRDPVTGAYTEESQQIVQACAGALIEISQSGTGLHIIGTCDQAMMKNKRRRWGGDKECYVSGRFVALTAYGLQGDPRFNITDAVVRLVPDRPDPALTGIPETGPVPEWSGPTDDMILVGQAIAARGSVAAQFGNHASFRDLWTANKVALAKHYPTTTTGQDYDASAADAAMVMHLGFWTGKDAARTERLWRMSALAQGRAKLDRGDYVHATITTGLQKVKAVYQGRKSGARTDADPIAQRLIGLGTHHDLALAFTQEHQGRYLFNVTRRAWLEWTGTHWQILPEGAMLDRVRHFCSLAESNRTKSVGFWQGVITTLQADPAFLRTQDHFDRDTWLLNTPSGTCDLRTGEFKAHDPSDHLTQITATDPDSGQGAAWSPFLTEVTCGDATLAADLQVMLGAGLSGAVPDHWIGYFFGSGRNGKSALIEVVAHALGSYARAVPSETFVAARNDPHPTGLTTLAGARFAYANEVPPSRHFNEALLKAVSGDAVIKARFMGGDYFDIPRTWKLFLIGNDLPQVKAVDVAIRRRLHFVPFNADFSGREDATLPDRLRAEAGTILHWLIEGHRKWVEAGCRFKPGPAIAAMSEDYFAAQSTPDMWLTERVSIVENDGRSASAWPNVRDLYQNYCEWKTSRREEPVTETRFGLWLKGKRSVRVVRANGSRCVGAALQSPQFPKILPFRPKN